MAKGCDTCKHGALPAYEGPCGSCSDGPPGSLCGSNWEPGGEDGGDIMGDGTGQIIKNCSTCRHESLPAFEAPCAECCLNESDLFGSRSVSHWEPKAEAEAEAVGQPAPADEDKGEPEPQWDGGGPVVETIEPYRFRGGIEPIEFIRSNRMGFLEGNIVKYLYRHPVAGGVEDLRKAMTYLSWLIEDVRQRNKSPAIGPEE